MKKLLDIIAYAIILFIVGGIIGILGYAVLYLHNMILLMVVIAIFAWALDRVLDEMKW